MLVRSPPNTTTTTTTGTWATSSATRASRTRPPTSATASTASRWPSSPRESPWPRPYSPPTTGPSTRAEAIWGMAGQERAAVSRPARRGGRWVVGCLGHTSNTRGQGKNKPGRHGRGWVPSSVCFLLSASCHPIPPPGRPDCPFIHSTHSRTDHSLSLPSPYASTAIAQFPLAPAPPTGTTASRTGQKMTLSCDHIPRPKLLSTLAFLHAHCRTLFLPDTPAPPPPSPSPRRRRPRARLVLVLVLAHTSCGSSSVAAAGTAAAGTGLAEAESSSGCAAGADSVA